MRYICVLFVCFSLIINFNLLANNEIDSLKRELNKQPKAKTAEINAKIAETYYKLNKDSAFKYANTALILSSNNNDLNAKAEAYRIIGKYYAEKRNIKLALSYFNNSINLFYLLKDQSRIADMYNSIGILYGKIYNYEKALLYIHKSVELLKVVGDNKKISTSLNNLSVVYRSQKNFNKSLEVCMQSLYYAKKSGDEFSIASSLNNISLAYIFKEKNKEALGYQLEAIAIFEKLKSKSRLCSSYMSVGSIYSKLKKNEKAREYYSKALVLALELKDNYLISFAFQNIGSKYLKDNDFEKAYNNLKKAEEYGQKINDLGCLKISSENLAEYYSKIGDYKNAFEYYKKFKTYNDSIYNADNLERFQDLQLKYEVEEKDKENKILKQESTIQKLAIQKQTYLKNTFIIVSITVIVIIIIVYFLLLSKRNANKKLSDNNQLITLQKDKLEEANAAKDKIFTLIGHDLKTPFYVILRYTQLLKNQFECLSDTEKKDNISELHDLTRDVYYVLENLLTWSRSQRGIIHVKKEIINLSALIYASIRPYQTNAGRKNLIINNLIDPSLNILADKYTLGTVIGNLFNNACKFTPSGGSITFEVVDNESTEIEILVKDTGIGIDDDKLKKLFQIGDSFSTDGTEKEKGTGLGLIICKEFIEYNNGSIYVESKINEGSVFTIKLPKE